MFILILITATAILWQEDFNSGTQVMKQLADYHVQIRYGDGRVLLRANPRFEGFSSSWLAAKGSFALKPDDLLKLRIRVSENTVRLRYFYYDHNQEIYLSGTEYIQKTEDWQKVEIPLRSATPFPSLKFPYLLIQDQRPPIYLFFENRDPGWLEVEIDQIVLVGSRGE